ncbi:hypothetical protein PT974_06366 [Cladobotryum mycophilum]|uniref:Uncharacterized protein n=1 Tax=Cladobotryum mycophilum TaxID=491253 RepID=A0ABR0SMA6_9HYPO
MASYGLKCLVNPDTNGVDDFVDVVIVPGFKTQDVDHFSKFFEQNTPRSRLSVFDYNIENICVLPGLQDIATQLLKAIVELRKGRTESIVFICREIGGLLVKEALTMAILGDIPFQDILTCISCVVSLLGYPHRSHNAHSLHEGLMRLFQLNESPTFNFSPIVVRSLAGLVNDINQRFLETQLPQNIQMMNVWSSHQDPNERIFDPFKTSMPVNLHLNNAELFQRGYSIPHRDLEISFVDELTWLWGSISFLLKIPPTSALSLLLSETHLQIIDVLPPPHQLVGTPRPKLLGSWSAISQSKAFLSWKMNTMATPVVIHDTKNTAATALLIFNHLKEEEPENGLVQFFEFRYWDNRYNRAHAL